jgi:hypothetical protein
MNDQKAKRIEFLEEDLKAGSNDPFVLYSLALEYREVDQSKSLSLFEQLLKDHPNYEATYFPYAELLLETEQLEEAAFIFKKGIILLEKTKNLKALAELRNAWQNAQIEYDLF